MTVPRALPDRAPRPTTTFHPGRRGVVHRRHWYAPGAPRARVVLVPGLGQHSGLYERLATWLTYDAVEVHALDPAGHGRSEGPRAALEDLGDLVTDVRALLADLPRRHTAPTVLVGAGVGGLAAYLATTLPSGAGAPTQRSAAPAVDGRVLAGTALLPLSVVERLLHRPGRPPVALRPGWLANGRAHRAALADDPLVHRGPLPGTTLRALRAAWTDSERLLAAGGDRLPTLLLHGERDRVVPIAAARVAAVLLDDARLHVAPDAGHDVLLDAPLRDVLDHLSGFVTGLVAGQTQPLLAAGA